MVEYSELVILDGGEYGFSFDRIREDRSDRWNGHLREMARSWQVGEGQWTPTIVNAGYQALENSIQTYPDVKLYGCMQI